MEAQKRLILSRAVQLKSGSEHNTGKLKVRREISIVSSQLFIKSLEIPSVPGTQWLNARPLPFEEIWENSFFYYEVGGVCPSGDPAENKGKTFQMRKFARKNLRYAWAWKLLLCVYLEVVAFQRK